ncbi:MAG: ABC transporter substrate-binding protein, partial [Nitrosopumilaceae archaeon]
TRINKVKNTKKGALPKILCLEWLDPLYTAGHWVPQMVDLAGGVNGISTTGEQSRRMVLGEAVKYDPEIIILMPCGFDVERTILEYEKLLENKIWRKMKAVKEGEVYAVNANEYFSKPGPRTVTGLEILAKTINPDTFRDLKIPKNSIQNLEL